VTDPYDPTCLQASLSGDAATCTATNDADGNPCEWCGVASSNLCLNSEQAEIVEQFGGDCSAKKVEDPYDTSCLMATLSGDEAACESTVDEDGNGCEWCSVNSVNLCLTVEQAEIAEQVGGQCSTGSDDDAPAADDDAAPDDDTTPDNYWKCLKGFSDKDGCTGGGCEWCATKAGYGICLDPTAAANVEKYAWFDCTTTLDLDLSYFQDEDALVTDPYDPTCLQASLSGDAATCTATNDADGNPCEWCGVASSNLCLNSEQAEIVEQFGGDCSAKKVEDPYDTSCLMATLSGDEAACESTVDEDGNGCEWCSVNSVNLCMTVEQAEIAEQIGGQCSTGVAELEDPYDPTCLQASLSGDAATCTATNDADGNPCEWCGVASSNLCLNSEQAEIVEQFGGDCSSAKKVEDPYDTSCLMATLSGDEAACESTVDEDGNGCEWCSVNSVNLCLTEEQAEIAQQIGGECSTMHMPSF